MRNFLLVVAEVLICYTTMIILNKKYGFSFTDTRKKLPGYIVSWLVFEVVIILMKLVITLLLF